jgi:hypothetical protein
MQMESHEKDTSSLMSKLYRGWFTPPATTKYRFHQSCDDYCDLKLGKTPDQDTDLEELLDINHWSEYRRTSYTRYGDQDRISKWVSLEKGKKYFI